MMTDRAAGSMCVVAGSASAVVHEQLTANAYNSLNIPGVIGRKSHFVIAGQLAGQGYDSVDHLNRDSVRIDPGIKEQGLFDVSLQLFVRLAETAQPFVIWTQAVPCRTPDAGLRFDILGLARP
jgi:hypothetical protein